MKYFIISGTPVYGFRYIGPFDSRQGAVDYQQANPTETCGTNWWVAELLAPLTPQEDKS